MCRFASGLACTKRRPAISERRMPSGQLGRSTSSPAARRPVGRTPVGQTSDMTRGAFNPPLQEKGEGEWQDWLADDGPEGFRAA